MNFDYLLPVGLVLITLLGSIASAGWDLLEMRNRESWWWTGVLLIDLALMPNLWMAGLLGVVILGTFQIGRAWFLLHPLIIPIAGLAGVYAALTPHMQPWMIPPVLWAMVLIGALLGCWALVSWRKGKTYRLHLPQGWWGWWGIYDYGGDCRETLCGHGNRMHLSAILSLCIASAVGLWWMGSWWALLPIPLMSVPLMMGDWQYNRKHPDQALLSMLVLGLGVWILIWPWTGLMATGGIGGVLLTMAKPWDPKPNHWDSGRFAYWKDALQFVWWPSGWKRRLFGFGTGTWFIATVQMGNERQHPRVLTAAHCEYVQQLVEHGVVGLVLLMGYVADALWRASQHGPEGQGLFLVGLVWCAIALVNFPWTFYHEYHPRGTQQEEWFGSPTLTALAFVMAILLEAF